MPRMLFAITLGLVVAVGGIFILNLVVDPVDDLEIADAVRHADQGRRHLEPGESFGDYNSFPPTSGPQSASAPEPGVYGADQPAPFNEVPEPSEFLPLLEQGGVVVYFDPSAASERDRETLQGLAFSRLERGHVIAIAPVEGLVDRAAAVVATAWRHTLPLDQLTAEAREALELFLTDLTAGGFQGRFVLDAAGRRESQAAVDARASEAVEASEGDEG